MKERMPLRKLLAEVNTMDVEGFMVEVERDGKDLVLDAKQLAALAVMDTNGRPHGLVDTSGQTLTKEASAATIANNLSQSSALVGEVSAQHTLGFEPRTLCTLSGSINYIARRLAVTLTATAGGEIAAAPLVAALAAYKSCCVVTGLWSDQTDGSISMTISTTSGLTFGPGTWIWGTTANTLTDYNQGVAFKGSAVAEAINVSCAAGQAGANQVIQVIGYYWYEAT